MRKLSCSRSILLIDSSVFIASLIETDRCHSASRHFFGVLERGEKQTVLVEPSTIILEIANVLTRSGRVREASLLLNYFTSVEIVPVDNEFITHAIPLLRRVNLKTADAIIAISAHLWDATLVSWDKKLLQEAKRITRAFTPEEYLKKELLK